MEGVFAMKIFRALIAVCLVVVLPARADDRDTLYQVSTLPALGAGLYEGFRPYEDILGKGDFGIGTFNGLEGEMILLDGVVYQVLVDGTVMRPEPTSLSPFATVKFFKPEQTGDIADAMDYKETAALLDGLLVTKNVPIAIRIEGVFEYVKARSVPAQEQPYPTLSAALEHQRIFEMTNVTGTAVGFRFPTALAGVQADGYHLHFITQDRQAGGHLLDFRLRDVRYEVDYAYDMLLEFPQTAEFRELR